jgi:Flp pilus assembly protein TadG
MVLPLLLIVGFIITEFGRALWIKNVVTQAAREGCRRAVVSTVSSGNKVNVATTRTDEFLTQAGAAFSGATVEAFLQDSDGSGSTDILVVRVTQPFSFIPTGDALPTRPFAAGGGEVTDLATINIVGEAIMHLEGSS